jgi:hypothetical protein
MATWIKNALGIAGTLAVIAIAMAICYLCRALVLDVAGVPALTAAYQQAAPKPGAIDSVATNLNAALPGAGKLTALVEHADKLLTVTSNGIQQTTANINRPCAQDGCGTLAQVDKTLVRVGDELTTTQLEQRNVFPHITAAMDSLKGTADGATGATQAVAGLASDPHLKAILAHADGMSDSGDKILADAYKEEHKLLFPDKKKLSFWGSVYAGAVTIDHFIPPLF